MSVLRAIGRFWYDFVIGDDWKIAAAIFLTVAVAAAVAAAWSSSWLAPLVGLALALAFTISLLVDVRR